MPTSQFNKLCKATLLATALFFGSAATADSPPDPGEQMNQAIGTSLQAGTEGFSQFSLHDFKMKVRPNQFKGFSPTNSKLLTKEWYTVSKGLKKGSARVGASGAFRFASWATAGAEIATDVISRASGGDYQGAVAGAGAIVAGQAFIHGASVAGGVAGGAIGATIGSAVPVVGTVVGQCIGGAVGKVAGGFTAAVAYDLLAKEGMTQALEGMIAPLFDTTSERVRAFNEMLRYKAAFEMEPLRKAHYSFSTGFGQREVQLDALPTVFLRPTPPPSTIATSETQSAPPPELEVVTSFDAMPIRSQWELSDGSSGEIEGEDLMETLEEQPLECVVFSIRDGQFGHRCPSQDIHDFDEGVVSIEGETLAVGIVTGNTLQGSFYHWARNYYEGFPDRPDMEYMRSYDRGFISGTISPDGIVTVVYHDYSSQVFDAGMVFEDGSYRETDEWTARDMEENGYPRRTIMTLRVAGTGEQGTLLRPGVTGQDIDAMDFDLPEIFFQHGVEPPERVR